jgi:hypothetical protein
MKKAASFVTCFGGGGVPAAPTELPAAPTEQDSRVIASRDNERRRRAAAASNTVLTSYRGVQSNTPTQGSKTLLGQ